MSAVRGDEYTGRLFEGQHVNCGLYYAGPGYIKQIDGEQAPHTIRRLSGLGVTSGGSANITVRFASGYESVVPECIVRGVQWYISDEPADIAEINRQYEHIKADKAAKAAAKAKHDAKQRAELPGKFPHLETFEQHKARTGKAVYDQELAAGNIRRELKRSFKGIKFSVKQERNAINIRWTDGPTVENVKKAIGRFDAGVMDWSGDYCDYKAEVWHELFGGVKYLFCNRDYSPAALAKGIAQVYNEDGYTWPRPQPQPVTTSYGTVYIDRDDADMMPNGWGWEPYHSFSARVYRLLDATTL